MGSSRSRRKGQSKHESGEPQVPKLPDLGFLDPTKRKAGKGKGRHQPQAGDQDPRSQPTVSSDDLSTGVDHAVFEPTRSNLLSPTSINRDGITQLQALENAKLWFDGNIKRLQERQELAAQLSDGIDQLLNVLHNDPNSTSSDNVASEHHADTEASQAHDLASLGNLGPFSTNGAATFDLSDPRLLDHQRSFLRHMNICKQITGIEFDTTGYEVSYYTHDGQRYPMSNYPPYPADEPTTFVANHFPELQMLLLQSKLPPKARLDQQTESFEVYPPSLKPRPRSNSTPRLELSQPLSLWQEVTRSSLFVQDAVRRRAAAHSSQNDEIIIETATPGTYQGAAGAGAGVSTAAVVDKPTAATPSTQEESVRCVAVAVDVEKDAAAGGNTEAVVLSDLDDAAAQWVARLRVLRARWIAAGRNINV